MYLKARIAQLLVQAVTELKAVGIIPAEVSSAPELERPADPEHGDYSTNLALKLAKPCRRPPRELAQALVDKLSGQKELLGRV